MKVTVQELKKNPLYNKNGFIELNEFIQPLLIDPENSLYDAFYEFVESHLDDASEDTILEFAHDNTGYLERAINQEHYTYCFDYSFFEHAKEAFRIMLEDRYTDLLEKYGELILEIAVIDMLDKKHIEIDSDSAEYGIIHRCIDEYIRDSQDGYYTTFIEFCKDLMDELKDE